MITIAVSEVSNAPEARYICLSHLTDNFVRGVGAILSITVYMCYVHIYVYMGQQC